ncbi:thioredoxin domain-containing protein [Sphingobacterium sp. lm-10]|uniref:vitamin K epoxide reductase family protein n=1 Tax=Sphingobacterium sp. lm-10 TaxID=2944904 RepID=UPI00202289C9|nr:vitamin K epoxide reductase family protein [Sphingobacterium sp. lm-10]MCL7986600.1 thioredoxin domain-containing protein [Sphingobacterium sp. lm-10]
MFSNLKLLSNKKHDSNVVLESVLEFFKVKFTDKGIDKSLTQHVEFPSLLTVKDVLSQYGIQSEAIRKGRFNYADFETPFVCSIQQDNWPSAMFTVVSDADEKSITYLDPIKGRNLKVDVQQFENIDKEVILLLDGEHVKDEVNYIVNKQGEWRDNLLNKLPYLLFVVPILLASIQLWFSAESAILLWTSFLFILGSSVGLIASILLIWYEIDSHNPFLKEVCGGNGRNVNCHAVLNSNSSNFLGISWSVWGFAYFASFYLTQFLYPGFHSQINLWSTISLVASPYILYSIYFQGRIIKQWCPLCLTVQVVLLINAIASLAYLSSDITPQWNWYLTSLTAMLSISFLIAGYFMIPLLKKAKDSKDYERKWKKMRYNSDIFYGLLQKSDSIMTPAEGLGIVVGNPDAKLEILKVCNPYCGPCAKAHPELEEIIQHNPNVKVRIIFTASGEDSDRKTAPVSHLLAIEEMLGASVVQKALDDWYLAEEKNYEIFASKYPMNEELRQQGEKIKRMYQWCNEMKIRATPTIYINGKELPESYQIAELKHILLDL